MALPPSFGQPGVSVSYQPKSLITNDGKSRCPVITVDVPPASIHHIFAHRQWRAGMLMSDALVTGAFDVQDAAVLELGAGTGMPCITACHLGEAKIVVCTDYDEQELVRVLKANIRANLPADPLKARLIKGVGHIWGKNIDDLLDTLPRGVDKFDVVLLADCLWDPLNHADLLKSVTAVLAHSSTARVHVIAGLHTGREKITSFLRRAFRLGLVLAPVSHPAVWPAMSPTYPLDSTPSADPVFAFATDRILELEVCGSADTADDQPRLTGMRRPFLVNGYGAAEEEVQKRNCWLTVWSLMWAA